MAREFPIPSNSTFVMNNITYERTAPITTLITDGIYVPHEQYFDGMFWGGISDNFNLAQAALLSFERNEDGNMIAKVTKYNQPSYSYAYTCFAGQNPTLFSSQYTLNWYSEKYENESFSEIDSNEYIQYGTVSYMDRTCFMRDIRISLMSLSFRVRAVDIQKIKELQNGNTNVQINSAEYNYNSIQDFLDAFNSNENLRAYNIYVSSSGYRDFNSDIYRFNNFGYSTYNTLFSKIQYAINAASNVVYYTSAAGRFELVDKTDSNLIYSAHGIEIATENENIRNVVTPYGYVEDFEIDIQSFLTYSGRGSGRHFAFINENDTGMIYISSSGSLGSFSEVIGYYPLMNAEQLLQYCASFGTSFITGSWANNVTVPLDSDTLYGPYLNNFIYNGEYSHGEDNKTNPFFGITKTSDSDYNPDDSGGGEDGNLPDIPGDPDIPDAEGDDIENQPNRTVSAPTNFITYYVVSDSIIQTLGKILWGEALDDSSNYWQNFATQVQYDTGSYNMQSIFSFLVSLRIFPFSVGTLPICISSGNSIKIGTGKVPLPMGGDVRRLTSVVGDVHAGSVTVALDDSYKDFRDIYNTTVTAFLPYCGTVELNPAEVIGNTLDCFYSVDFSTGNCIAFIEVLNDGKRYNLAVKEGNIGALLPLTATNAGQVSARMGLDYSQGQLMASNGLSAVASSFDITKPLSIVSSGLKFMNLFENAYAMKDERVMRSAIEAPMLSGGNGIASFLMPATAYIQVRRGQYYDPPSYDMGHTLGYVSATKGRLGSFKLASGLTYIECNNVDVTSLPCTNSEKQIIKQLLESGVYI